MTQTTENKPTFDGLGIAPAIMGALSRARFFEPTPIQQKAIPLAVTGADVVGIAQTGTGKTLAFAVPMIQKLLSMPGRALIVVPTRELAIQVDETVQRIGRPLNINTAVLIGGISMYGQVQALRRNPRVIVATPGRLIDHLQQRTTHLSDVRALVLDEADRMFDMGFAPAIKKIMDAMPPIKERQTMLFSATMPPEIMKLASQYMHMPVRVEIVQPGTTAERVAQEIIFVKKEEKASLLREILATVAGPVLVFTRTKHGARKLTQSLRTSGITAAEIHSDRSLAQRRQALEGFKAGSYRVLVATDIAARGIDVKGIELVVNFDLPDASDDYVHRIGRTGRAGREGRAISFATPDQRHDVVAIERLIRMRLPTRHHAAPAGTASAPAVAQPVLRDEEGAAAAPRTYRSHRQPRGFAPRERRFDTPGASRSPNGKRRSGPFRRKRVIM